MFNINISSRRMQGFNNDGYLVAGETGVTVILARQPVPQ